MKTLHQISIPSDALHLILSVLRIFAGLTFTAYAKINTPWQIEAMYRIYSFFAIVGLGFLFVLSEFINLFFIDDVELFVDSSYVLVELMAMLVKVFFFTINKKNIQYLLDTCASPIFMLHTREQNHFVEASMQTVRKNSRIYYVFVSLTCIFIWLAPILKGVHQLSLPGWFPFKISRSPTFEIVYIWQAMSVTITALLNASIDLISSSAMILACGQFKVLADNLQNIRKKAVTRLKTIGAQSPINIDTRHCNDFAALRTQNLYKMSQHGESVPLSPSHTIVEQYANEEIEREIYKELVTCIEHHNVILTFLTVVENTFTFTALAQVLASVLVICLTTFELTIIKFGDSKIISLVSYQFALLLQIFLYCWYGNEVYYTSLEIFDSAYMSGWEECSTKVRKAIFLIMNRAQRPVKLTAGKILALTLDTFIGVLRLSYSFLVLLQQAHSSDEP